MDRRLEMLEKMVAAGQADSFARYALALEYQKQDRHPEALSAFEALRAADPSYLPMYLMAGQLLIDLDRGAEARPWLEAGIALAAEGGDAKTQSEIESALSQCAD